MNKSPAYYSRRRLSLLAGREPHLNAKRLKRKSPPRAEREGDSPTRSRAYRSITP
jgi:hypothetical protein